VNVRERREWEVVDDDGNVVAGGFRSNAEAWAWIDRRDPEHHEDVDRQRRIRAAFSKEDKD
jgi:hypothetical protein